MLNIYLCLPINLYWQNERSSLFIAPVKCTFISLFHIRSWGYRMRISPHIDAIDAILAVIIPVPKRLNSVIPFSSFPLNWFEKRDYTYFVAMIQFDWLFGVVNIYARLTANTSDSPYHIKLISLFALYSLMLHSPFPMEIIITLFHSREVNLV